MIKTILHAMPISAMSILLLLTACGKNAPETGENLQASGDPVATDAATDYSQEPEASGGLSASGDPVPDMSTSVADYFPIKSNTFYMYECAEQPVINQEHYITYATETNGVMRVQRRVSSGKVSSTEVLEISRGELRFIYGEPMFYFFEDLTSVTPNSSMIVLKEPLEIGQKWTPNESSRAEITATDVPVRTAAGSFECLEITTTYPEQNFVQREYYAHGVGMVKTVYPSDEGMEYNLELTNIIEGKGMDIETVFYARSSEGIKEEARTITFATNGDLLSIFNDAFSIKSADGFEWLPGGSQIKTIEPDRVNDKIIITMEGDMGDELVLQSIADTLGVFYDTISADVICGGTTHSFTVIGKEPSEGSSVAVE